MWWQAKEQNSKYEFFDGATEPNFRPEGPQLLHFRTDTSTESSSYKACAWKKILHDDIPLPTPSVKVFDSNGDLISRKSFNTVEPQTHEPMEVDIHTDHTADDDNEVLYISDNVQIDIAEDTDTLETPQSEQSSSGSETSSVALLASLPTAPSKPPLRTKLGNAFYKALSPTHDQETSRKIQKLDKLRDTLKSRKDRAQPARVSEYTTILAEMQQKLLLSQTQARETVRTYETTCVKQQTSTRPVPRDQTFFLVLARALYINRK